MSQSLVGRLKCVGLYRLPENLLECILCFVSDGLLGLGVLGGAAVLGGVLAVGAVALTAIGVAKAKK